MTKQGVSRVPELEGQREGGGDLFSITASAMPKTCPLCIPACLLSATLHPIPLFM